MEENRDQSDSDLVELCDETQDIDKEDESNTEKSNKQPDKSLEYWSNLMTKVIVIYWLIAIILALVNKETREVIFTAFKLLFKQG